MGDQCALAAGKGLGGGTAINGMMYTRGNIKDYDLWADLGNDGWCYKDVLPYFLKAEDADLKHFDHKYHNHGGPLHIEHPRYQTELTPNLLSAAKELGIEIVDYNGKEQLGLGVLQFNAKKGKRHSTAQAYLEPAMKRPNLDVQPLSHVIKILITPHNKEATGVLYLKDGKLHAAKARKEVILSAGTVNSAQLLKLSGIGPKEELEHFEIPIIKDLPVGLSLKDHIAFFGLDFIYNGTYQPKVQDKEYDPVLDYLKNGNGILTSTGPEIISFFKTKASKQTINLPDIELFFVHKVLTSTPELNPFRIKQQVFDSLWKPVEGKTAINTAVVLLHPKSTGSVKLQDKDPLHLPIVDLNQLTDPDDHDLETLVEGVKEAAKIFDSKTMLDLGLTLNPNPISGCESYKVGSDEYWKCAIKHLSISLRHVVGTAKMGPVTDKEAVVDNKLRVYGVHKLRVADASVIPVTLTGHTMAPAVMIGEKASDLIKNDWK